MSNLYFYLTEGRSSLEEELSPGKGAVAGSIPASGSYSAHCRRGSVVERLTCNQLVGGSIPSGGSFLFQQRGYYE